MGVDIIKNTKTKQFEIVEHILESKGRSTMTNPPLLSPQLAILLVAGDILESVNGVPCRRSGDLYQLYQRILQHQKESSIITLTFACLPDEANNNHHHHHTTSSSSSQQRQKRSTFVHQVIYISNKDNLKMYHHAQQQQKQPDSPQSDEPDVLHKEEHKGDDVNAAAAEASAATDLIANTPELPQQQQQHEHLQLPTIQKEDTLTKTPILRLNTIPKSNWLIHSCARPGDVVLSINSIPCYELYPDDANLVCQTMVQTHPYVSFKFYTPQLTRKESIRRAAVATAGKVIQLFLL